MIYDHVSGSLSELDSEMVITIPEGGNWRNLPESISSVRVRKIRQSAARGEGSRSTYYGRLRWDRPCYTISTYFNRPGNGCFIHPQADRLITIREAARLQSFPDSYRFFGKGRARYIQVGNAVPPLLAYHLGCVLNRGTAVDLFSGAGGLSLGLEWAGFDVLAAVDNDAPACQTYQENRPKKSLALTADLSDSSDLRAVVDEIKVRTLGHGRISLVAGGPPCQGFSTAGNCRLDDSRNRLVFAFINAVAALDPMQVLMENVASMIFRGRRQILEDVRNALHQLKYRSTFIVAHAEGYGVPQLRRRLFLLASKDSIPRWPSPYREILPPMMSKFQPWAGGVTLEKPVTVMDAIGDLPLETADSPDQHVDYSISADSKYQRWARGQIEIDALYTNPKPIHGPLSLFDAEGR